VAARRQGADEADLIASVDGRPPRLRRCDRAIAAPEVAGVQPPGSSPLGLEPASSSGPTRAALPRVEPPAEAWRAPTYRPARRHPAQTGRAGRSVATGGNAPPPPLMPDNESPADRRMVESATGGRRSAFVGAGPSASMRERF
jgi:hypothetical protein